MNNNNNNNKKKKKKKKKKKRKKKKKISTLPYLPTPQLEQDMIQGQFLSGVY